MKYLFNLIIAIFILFGRIYTALFYLTVYTLWNLNPTKNWNLAKQLFESPFLIQNSFDRACNFTEYWQFTTMKDFIMGKQTWIKR